MAGTDRPAGIDPGSAGAAAGRGTAGSRGVNTPDAMRKPTVVLVSFDGMRWDYLDRGITPNFTALAAAGTRAESLIPVFPTTTFPNHYSIATGRYTEGHGLVANRFYDSGLGAFYRYTDSTTVRDARFYRGEPLWATAERQGMVSASLFWVGSEAKVGGVQPSTVWNFDATIADTTRVRAFNELLRRPPETRPHFIAIYFAEVDHAGHSHGPDAPETNHAIAYADTLLGMMMRGIAALAREDSVSLVVVSDHGMIKAPNAVLLPQYMDTTGVLLSTGPVASLWFRGDSVRMRQAYRDLQRMPNARTYYRTELPVPWHYGDPRGGDIVVVADPGWQIDTRQRSGPVGTHGYPPELREMHGIFVAAGPRIRAGYRPASFESVHVYPLITELLRLRPDPAIDGRLQVVRPILRN